MTTSPDPSGFDISTLRREEVRAATEVLSEALIDDPGWVAVVADRARRRTALRSITGVAVRDAMPFGHVLAARTDTRVIGVAVWLPPGSYPMSGRRKAAAARTMLGLAVRLPRDIRHLARFGDAIDAAFPTSPVWYLQALGVHPDAQRQGLGRRLIRPAIRIAADAGIACYLETALPSNIGFYQEQGFSLIAPPAPLVAGGAPMALMATQQVVRTSADD